VAPALLPVSQQAVEKPLVADLSVVPTKNRVTVVAHILHCDARLRIAIVKFLVDAISGTEQITSQIPVL
jgi:hypothetical protein